MVWYSSIIPMAASPLISGTTTTGRYRVFTPHERSSCRPFVKSCNWRSGSMPSVGSPPSVQRDASPFDAPNVAGTANCFRQRWKNILRYSGIVLSRRWQPQRSIPTWSFKSHVHNNYPNPCSNPGLPSFPVRCATCDAMPMSALNFATLRAHSFWSALSSTVARYTFIACGTMRTNGSKQELAYVVEPRAPEQRGARRHASRRNQLPTQRPAIASVSDDPMVVGTVAGAVAVVLFTQFEFVKIRNRSRC